MQTDFTIRILTDDNNAVNKHQTPQGQRNNVSSDNNAMNMITGTAAHLVGNTPITDASKQMFNGAVLVAGGMAGAIAFAVSMSLKAYDMAKADYLDKQQTEQLQQRAGVYRRR